jgi:hypothetical protein
VLGLQQKYPPTIGNAVEGRTSAGMPLGQELSGAFIAGSLGLFNVFPVGFEEYFLDQTHDGSSTLLTVLIRT